MKEFQKKQRVRRIIYSIPSLAVLAILTFFLLKGLAGVVSKERESAERAKVLAERAAALSVRQRELSEGVARLGTEEGIRNEIRERFSVTQEGEYVAVIVDDRNASTSADMATKPWYKKLWDAIVWQ